MATKLIPIDSKYISYIVSTKTKTVPKLDPSTSLPIWVNIETGEQVFSTTNPDPNYVPVMTSIEVSVVSVSIDKEGIPEGAKKINFVYWYTTNNTTPEEPEPQEPDVEQPESGTVKSVGIDIPIDNNTTYPITGEFELDGTPDSVDAVANKTVTYEKFESADYFYGLRYDFQTTSNNPDSQLELLQGDFAPYQGGIALKGTKVTEPVVGGE